jgi:hypothetical protein
MTSWSQKNFARNGFREKEPIFVNFFGQVKIITLNVLFSAKEF